MWTVRHPTAAVAPPQRPSENVWWGLLAFGIVLTIIARAAWQSAPEPDDAEVSLVGQVLGLAGLEPATFGVSPAAVQVALWTSTGAWDRAATVLGAAREAMLVTSAITAVLVWLLTRRLGLGSAWATAALMLLAICPPLLDVQGTVVTANVGLPWLLGALVLATAAGRRWLLRDAGVVVCTVAAVVTAPIMVALVPSVLWLAARPRAPRHALWLGGAVVAAVVAALVLAPVLGFGAAVRDAGLGNLLAPERITADPVTPLVVAVVTVLGLAVWAVRPIAAGLLVVPVVAVLTGEPWAAVVATAVPLGFLLLAGLIGGVVDTAARPVRHRRRLPRAHLYAPVGTTALVIGALAVWSPVIGRLPATLDAGATAAAREWTAQNGSTSELVLSGARTQLAVVNARDWVHVRVGSAADEVEATFGQGADAVSVRSLPGSGVGQPRETAAPRTAGELLAASDRLEAVEPLRELLRQGRVNPQGVLTLGTLLTDQRVRLADLPAVAAEDAVGLPRHHLLLQPLDGSTDRIVSFYLLQRGVFAPSAVILTPDGVLVSYPPAPEARLADGFPPEPP